MRAFITAKRDEKTGKRGRVIHHEPGAPVIGHAIPDAARPLTTRTIPGRAIRFITEQDYINIA